MENLMLDYYDLDKLKIVGARLVEFYKTVVDRYAGWALTASSPQMTWDTKLDR